MKNGRQTSLQRNLIRISMVTSVMALLLSSAAFIITDYVSFRRNMETALISLASVVGSNSQAALLFDDQQAASETLDALAAVPNVVTGRILNLELNTFAEFSRSGKHTTPSFNAEALPTKGFSLHDGLAVVVHPIHLQKEPLGWVYLTADLQGLKAHLLTYGLICTLILIGTAALAFLFSARLQRRISTPILELVDTMKAVSSSQDYALRHGDRRDDEIGALIDGFNAMLDQLQERDRELRLTQFAMDHTSDAAFYLDEGGKIFYVNHAACQMLEYAPYELLQLTMAQIDPSIASENGRSNYQEDDGQAYAQATTQHKTKSGAYVPVEVTANRLSFEARRYTCVFSRDISEKQRMAERLQRAKKMETLGNLAAGVAHDLNNILSGLVSYPELLLLEMRADDPLRSPLATIQKSGQKAADIVEDLLTLSRRGVSVNEVADLNHIIKDYLRSPEFAKLERQHPKVTLASDLADDLFNLKGSAIHLSKTLMNLVVNAAEAMPDGGVISLVTRNCYVEASGRSPAGLPEGEYVHLKVRDTGVGISAEDREHIFEPFFTKKKMGTSGTGLGMSVVWATVQDHAGAIEVTSEEGRGTHFDLYFPATREVVDFIDEHFVLEDYLGSESILVVDDVEEQRTIASQMLAKLGYQVETAESGEAALERLRQGGFDLVVLDMIMSPGIDGLDTYERMQTISPLQPTIIASGFSESERVQKMQQLGAGAYLKKPYTLEKLAKTVRGALIPAPPANK
jgi:PAS domain S-box-containing protein